MKQRLLRLSSLRQAQPSKLNKFPSDNTNNTEQRRPHAESPLFFVGLRSYGCEGVDMRRAVCYNIIC